MFGLFKRRASVAQVARKIRWVAEAIRQPGVLAQRAKEAALELGPASIPKLVKQCHAEHTLPPELAEQFPGLGQWIAARQVAIFEMLYCFREAALPVLRRMAYGEYDWTQGNAIEVLCRLAAEGVNTEPTVAEIRAALPEMRSEAVHYAFGPLLARAAGDATLARLLARFSDIPKYNEMAVERQNA